MPWPRKGRGLLKEAKRRSGGPGTPLLRCPSPTQYIQLFTLHTDNDLDHLDHPERLDPSWPTLYSICRTGSMCESMKIVWLPSWQHDDVS